MIRFAIVLLSLFTSLQIFAADYVKQCDVFGQPLPGGYCIFKPTANASRDIVYYFHGRGGNLDYFLDDEYYTGQIRTEWAKHHARLPTVIAISFGGDWFLAEKNASAYSGLFEVVTQQIMPKLEAAIGGKRGRRILFGESMGGFNTVQLALKTKLFDKAAILCAPMSTISIFATTAEIEAYVLASHAHKYWVSQSATKVLDQVNEAATLAKMIFPTPADWDKGNPLTLAETSRSRTQLYVAAGFYDPYALYEGNEKFADTLEKRHRRIDWRPQWGGHCTMDIPSLAKFLVR